MDSLKPAVPEYSPEIARLQMLLGKAHDRIAQLETELIKRTIELNDLHDKHEELTNGSG